MDFKKATLYSSLGLLFVGFVTFLALLTIRKETVPAAKPIMRPTKFANLSELGAVVYRRMIFEIAEVDVMALGSHPNIPSVKNLWRAFIATAANEGWAPDLILQDHSMPLLSDTIPTLYIDLRAEGDRAKEIISQHLSRGMRVVLHSNAESIAWGSAQSILPEYEAAVHKNVLAMTAIPLIPEKVEIEHLMKNCNGFTLPYTDLECLSAYSSKVLSRRAIASTSISAAVEMHAQKDIILLVHEPAVQ